jgi:hypothetical protein
MARPLVPILQILDNPVLCRAKEIDPEGFAISADLAGRVSVCPRRVARLRYQAAVVDAFIASRARTSTTAG